MHLTHALARSINCTHQLLRRWYNCTWLDAHVAFLRMGPNKKGGQLVESLDPGGTSLLAVLDTCQMPPPPIFPFIVSRLSRVLSFAFRESPRSIRDHTNDWPCQGDYDSPMTSHWLTRKTIRHCRHKGDDRGSRTLHGIARQRSMASTTANSTRLFVLVCHDSWSTNGSNFQRWTKKRNDTWNSY